MKILKYYKIGENADHLHERKNRGDRQQIVERKYLQ